MSAVTFFRNGAGGGGALPYLAYAGMRRWTGYGFQGLES